MSAPVSDFEIQAAARLLAEGRPEEAARGLERLTADAPAYAAAHVLLARALEAGGRPADALEAWHRAHFLVPTSPLVRRERQRLLDAAPQAEAPDAPAPEAVPAESDPAMEPAPEPDAGPAPIDAAWSDEPAPADEQSPPDEAPADEQGDGFELVLTPGVDPRSVSDRDDPPPEARLFAEDAFEADDAAPAEGVFTAVPELTMDPGPAAGPRDAPGRHPVEDVGDDEGWTLIDETEHERPQRSGPDEADVAPPLRTATGWEVVPSDETRPAAPTSRPSSLDWDLDALIREIEEAPRIRPDPHFVAPTGQPADSASDDEDVVSETIARIYESQGQFAEAAAAFDKLAAQRPDRSEEFRRHAAELRGRAGG